MQYSEKFDDYWEKPPTDVAKIVGKNLGELAISKIPILLSMVFL